MRKNLQFKAWILLVVFTAEIFVPTSLFALGSGPSQPEMASFTPAGTNEMVDPFTGDFSYNIPLMDVEGYPINIAYNSGVTMEQEASWVGLGWNLNLGAITRSVRGLPDDFKGESITKEVSMKEMRVMKLGAGTSSELIGMEILAISANYGISFIHNNYKGFGVELEGSIGASIGGEGAKKGNESFPELNGNVGLSINSLDGTSINSSLSLNASGLATKAGSFSFGASLGSGYNTRTGKKILDFGTTAGFNPNLSGSIKNLTINTSAGSSGYSFNTSFLPIGMETYTPYSTTKMETNTFAFSGSVGGEVFGLHPNFNLDGSVTTQKVEEKISNIPAYGYLYTEESTSENLKDYNNDRSVELNKNTKNLSPVNFTYDVYNVSGQGVSGMFRPFRNDIGILSQPAYKIKSSKSNSIGIELGFGVIFKGGASFSDVTGESKHGPWIAGNAVRDLAFEGNKNGSLYEKFYFKAAGDKSESDLDYLDKIGGFDAIAFNLSNNDALQSLKTSSRGQIASLPTRDENKRFSRAKVFSTLTAIEATYGGLDQIESFSGKFYKDSLQTNPISRVSAHRKEYHISEITQTNPDGERFVFGIPAYNNLKEDVIYTTEFNDPNSKQGSTVIEEGIIHHSSSNESEIGSDNDAGIDGYYSSTKTPGYAHSYLLTGKTSADYQDVTGDGITPDDIGSAHKFNYTRTSTAYKWRAPYEGSSFLKGYESNRLDQKGSFSYGEKEMWYLHSLESKNQIVEFYTSPREDALGAGNRKFGGVPSQISDEDRSFKLDSIKLYDKLDRLKNKEQAIPIKRIEFTYDYSRCKGVKNQEVKTSGDDQGTGKLTLLKIETSYGENNNGKESPYVFNYSVENPDYNANNIDRWGNYKKRNLNPGNAENNSFPYVLQEFPDTNYNSDSLSNSWASAWALTEVELPTGGRIQITYESDDYGYVQHKDAMQMFPVLGAGNSIVFSSDDHLYDNNFLYIKRPTSVPLNLNAVTLHKLFFGKDRILRNMFFKFKADIEEGHDRYEFASGYSSAFNIGYCTNDDYLYVQIPTGSPNSISKMIWSVFRLNLFEVLYDQPNVNDTGLESVLRGMLANVGEIMAMFTDVEEELEKREIANRFKLEESFIRLNNPNKFKKGGGSRVQSIVLDDGWNSMSGEGENSTYGQYYEYKTLNEDLDTISSGVATYEPAIGNDENPWKNPAPYVAQQAQGHIPAIEAFQQTPFGESFFPSASVGYSKVTVKNIHFNRGKSSKAVTEHRFYTAKDFPVLVKETRIDIKDTPPKKGTFNFPLINNERHSIYTASQGYSIILNDMHGKPQSTINYLVDTSEGLPIKKELGGTIYNYHTKETTDGMVLDNKVKVLTADGYVKDKLLGVESDLAIETRRSYEKSTSGSYQGNLELMPGPVIPPVISTVSGNRNGLTDKKETRTIITTKVVQMYGLIKSTKTFTDQYATTAENKVFDATTGEVLLSETVDEHLEKEFTYSMPAYSLAGQERMGPAYENIGYVDNIITLGYDEHCNPDNDAYFNPGHFKHGDEVLLYQDGLTPVKAWVELEKLKPLIDSSCIPIIVDSVPVIPIDTTPKPIPLKPRMLTQWIDWYGTPCGVELISDSTGNFKGQRGKILEEAYIFPLKEKYRDTILAIDMDTTTHYFNSIKIEMPEGIDRLLMPNDYYKKENKRFCQTFGSVDNNGVPVNTLFSSGQDLNYEVDVLDYSVDQLFDLNDTIQASVEKISATSQFLNNYSFDRYPNNITLHERNQGTWGYSVKYKGCYTSSYYLSQLRAPYSIIKNPSGSFFNVIKWGVGHHNFLYDGRTTLGYENFFKRDCSDSTYRKLYGSLSFVNGVDSRKELKLNVKSSSNFRIQDDSTYLADNATYLNNWQLYLVGYTIELADGTQDIAYYVEKGKQISTYGRNCYFDSDAYGHKVWPNSPADTTQKDTVIVIGNTNIPDTIVYDPPCLINFRLLDQNGNYFSGLTEDDKLKVIRSGNDNQLISKTGQVSSLNDPMDVDLIEDSCKFLGLKTAEDGLKIINASNVTYKERNAIQSSYLNSGNVFLKGEDGAFKVANSMNYVSSRAQTASIETRKDGYMEVSPSLWAKGACNESFFPPEWKASSGWFVNSEVTKFNEIGQGTESKNSLDIYSTSISNERGGVELVASNASQNNVAFDNFELSGSLGINGMFAAPKFQFSNLGAPVDNILLSSGSRNYQYRSYPANKKIIEGVAHSGNASLFLKGEKPLGTADSVVVAYTDRSVLTLDQRVVSEEIIDSNRTFPVHYSTTSENHYTSFTANSSTTIKTELSDYKLNGVHEENLIIAVGDSNGMFKPDSGQYLLSIWTKELVASGTPYAGSSPFVEIINGVDTTVARATGSIIDGWQKVELEFTYSDTSDLKIKFNGGLWGCFFDDLRIQPMKSNVNTYIYDQFSNRLVAKLDENNYATFYEYDSEGIPSQLKRETDKGIITISESRQSIHKK